MGVFVNIGTGLLISRVKVRTLAVTSALVALIGGPLMATIDVHQSYWLAAFWAMLLSPVSCDGMYPLSISQVAFGLSEGALLLLMLSLTMSSALHRRKPSHIRCVSGGCPIACGRCPQRSGSIWQLCRFGGHCCNCGIRDGAFGQDRLQRRIDARLSSFLLGNLYGHCGCRGHHARRIKERWIGWQEGGIGRNRLSRKVRVSHSSSSSFC